MTTGFNENTEIDMGFFDNDKKLPLVITPKRRGLKLIDFLKLNQNEIEENLLKHGGILFRGFQIDGLADFESSVKNCYGDLIDYNDRATHRTQVEGKVYTATNYPPELEIILHNESSFAAKFPTFITNYVKNKSRRSGIYR